MPAELDLEACYLRYGPLVYRRCLRLLGSPAQAEEAMHDVFVTLLRQHSALEDRGLSSLLFRMATQVSLNRLRTRRRHPEQVDDALLDQIAASEDFLERSMAAGVLTQLFGREPVSTRVIAVMHFVDGMTLEEVAAEVQMSVSGVRKRLRKLREQLDALMKEDVHEPAQ